MEGRIYACKRGFLLKMPSKGVTGLRIKKWRRSYAQRLEDCRELKWTNLLISRNHFQGEQFANGINEGRYPTTGM
jgi:alpha-mannosidase